MLHKIKTAKTSFFAAILAAVIGTALVVVLGSCKQDHGGTVTVSVTEVKLDKTTLSLVKDTIGNLTATVLPANAANKKITWSSSKPNIASIAQDGTVTAKSQGSAVITVTTQDGGKTAKCTVTVTEAAVAVTGVTLNETAITLIEGSNSKLIASIEPVNATNTNVTWSSDNEGIASIAQDGTVTAKSQGSAVITVTTQDGGKTASCTVTVTGKPVSVTGLTLDKTTLKLIAGETYRLTAVIEPENATNKNVNWSSDNEGIASIAQDGTVTAKAQGSAVITATTQDGGKTATCTVTVENAPEQHTAVLTLSPDKKDIVIKAEANGNITVEGCTENSLTSGEVTTLNATGEKVILKGDITSLTCNGNMLTALNVSKLPSLQELNCRDNNLTTLDIQNLTSLEKVRCQGNQITNINVSGCTSLQRMFCHKNNLTELNMQDSILLKWLECQENQLTVLNLQGLAILEWLECNGNKLTSLDLQGLVSLKKLNCESNALNRDAFIKIFDDFVQRHGKAPGSCKIYTEKTGVVENNYKNFTAEELQAVKDKNWKIYKIDSNGKAVQL